MKNIYKVRILDKEGRSTVNSAYFMDKQDAENYRERYDVVHNSSSIDEFSVWEKGEYSPESDLKIQALSKLSIEERKALGLD